MLVRRIWRTHASRVCSALEASRLANYPAAKLSERLPSVHLQENIALEPLPALHRSKPGEGLFTYLSVA